MLKETESSHEVLMYEYLKRHYTLESADKVGISYMIHKGKIKVEVEYVSKEFKLSRNHRFGKYFKFPIREEISEPGYESSTMLVLPHYVITLKDMNFYLSFNHPNEKYLYKLNTLYEIGKKLVRKIFNKFQNLIQI